MEQWNGDVFYAIIGSNEETHTPHPQTLYFQGHEEQEVHPLVRRTWDRRRALGRWQECLTRGDVSQAREERSARAEWFCDYGACILLLHQEGED